MFASEALQRPENALPSWLYATVTTKAHRAQLLPRNMATPEMASKAIEAKVRKWLKGDVWAVSSRAAGDKTTNTCPIPETIANQLITVTDLGRGGTGNLVLQKGQKPLTNQSDLPQLGHIMVFPSAPVAWLANGEAH